MTWLDIGNGWRNLFLLSTAVQALCLGGVFAGHRLFSARSRLACFLTGVAVTPLYQFLCMLILALVCPKVPRIVWLLFPPVLCLIIGGWNLFRFLGRSHGTLKEQVLRFRQWIRRRVAFDKAALCCLVFAVCMALLIVPPVARFMSSMKCTEGPDCSVYLGMAQRFCEERDTGALFEKNDTSTAYRGHSHFPSMELYMSYGLFHTGGEIGYPNDKAVFTAVGLLPFFALAAYAALLLHFCRERKGPVLLGFLLVNLIPNLYASIATAPRDIWRILGVLVLALVLAGLRENGERKNYIQNLIWIFAACFAAMSTHVVCFVVIPFLVIAFALSRIMDQLRTQRFGLGKCVLRTLSLCLSGAAGTLLAFSGNLWCWFKWKELSPWRLMTTYTQAPWYQSYMLGEYKLEETTTHLNFFTAKDQILSSYSTKLGDFALILSLVMLILCIVAVIRSRLQMCRETLPTEKATSGANGPVRIMVRHLTKEAIRENELGLIALFVILSLAPMAGVLDTGYYCFSGSFLKLPRYTLQWFFLGNVGICAALAAFMDALPRWIGQIKFPEKLQLSSERITRAGVRIAAILCSVCCLAAMVKGVNQTGYTNTLYRASRDVMEDEHILLDNGYRERFAFLTEAAKAVPQEENIILSRDSYQYPLHSRGMALLANPVVPLMNETEDHMAGAMQKLHVGLLVTEPDFWDNRYFAESHLAAWLNTLPPEQILEDEYMRIYVVDGSLTSSVQAAYDRTHPKTTSD